MERLEPTFRSKAPIVRPLGAARTERLGALRKAFQAMLANPEFIAICEQRRLMIDPGTGEELDALARATLQLPPALLAKVAAMME